MQKKMYVQQGTWLPEPRVIKEIRCGIWSALSFYKIYHCPIILILVSSTKELFSGQTQQSGIFSVLQWCSKGTIIRLDAVLFLWWSKKIIFPLHLQCTANLFCYLVFSFSFCLFLCWTMWKVGVTYLLSLSIATVTIATSPGGRELKHFALWLVHLGSLQSWSRNLSSNCKCCVLQQHQTN